MYRNICVYVIFFWIRWIFCKRWTPICLFCRSRGQNLSLKIYTYEPFMSGGAHASGLCFLLRGPTCDKTTLGRWSKSINFYIFRFSRGVVSDNRNWWHSAFSLFFLFDGFIFRQHTEILIAEVFANNEQRKKSTWIEWRRTRGKKRSRRRG